MLSIDESSLRNIVLLHKSKLGLPSQRCSVMKLAQALFEWIKRELAVLRQQLGCKHHWQYDEVNWTRHCDKCKLTSNAMWS